MEKILKSPLKELIIKCQNSKHILPRCFLDSSMKCIYKSKDKEVDRYFDDKHQIINNDYYKCTRKL